jgi:hypothetical protein
MSALQQSGSIAATRSPSYYSLTATNDEVFPAVPIPLQQQQPVGSMYMVGRYQPQPQPIPIAMVPVPMQMMAHHPSQHQMVSQPNSSALASQQDLLAQHQMIRRNQAVPMQPLVSNPNMMYHQPPAAPLPAPMGQPGYNGQMPAYARSSPALQSYLMDQSPQQAYMQQQTPHGPSPIYSNVRPLANLAQPHSVHHHQPLMSHHSQIQQQQQQSMQNIIGNARLSNI